MHRELLGSLLARFLSCGLLFKLCFSYRFRLYFFLLDFLSRLFSRGLLCSLDGLSVESVVCNRAGIFYLFFAFCAKIIAAAAVVTFLFAVDPFLNVESVLSFYLVHH